MRSVGSNGRVRKARAAGTAKIGSFYTPVGVCVERFASRLRREILDRGLVPTLRIGLISSVPPAQKATGKTK